MKQSGQHLARRYERAVSRKELLHVITAFTSRGRPNRIAPSSWCVPMKTEWEWVCCSGSAAGVCYVVFLCCVVLYVLLWCVMLFCAVLCYSVVVYYIGWCCDVV